MLTAAARIRISGMWALVARRGSAAAHAWTPPDRETAAMRRAARIRRAFAAGAALGSAIGATPASAESRKALSVAQAGVGTLPLLAAMGIGIAVAAIAVIAFLQMTTKAKDIREDEWVEEEQEEAQEKEQEKEQGEAQADENRSFTAVGRESSEPDGFAEETGCRPPEKAKEAAPYTMPLPLVTGEPEAARPAEAGKPSLLGIEGEFAGTGFEVTERWLTLGRDSALCGLAFPYEAGEISRRHCSLKYERRRGLFLLEDHDSSNGTFLSGGERLDPGIVYELPPGSRFSLSGSRHWFEVQL